MPFAALLTSSRILCALLASITLASAAGATMRVLPAELAHLEKVVLVVHIYPELGGMADEPILERQATLELEERGIRVESMAQLRARGLDLFQSPDPTLWISVSSKFEPGEDLPGTLKVELHLQEAVRLRRGIGRRWGQPVGLSTYRRERVVPAASRREVRKVALAWVKSMASSFAGDVVEATDSDYFARRGSLAGWWHRRTHDRRHRSLVGPIAVPGPADPISNELPETEGCAGASYTEAAKKARASGTAVVDVIVNGDGRVAAAQLTRDLPHGLGEAALEAARWWRFYPSEASWRRASLEFVFELVPGLVAQVSFCETPLRAIVREGLPEALSTATASQGPSPERPARPAGSRAPQPCGYDFEGPPAPSEPLFPVSEEIAEVLAYSGPQYTEAGRRARITGTVRIDVLIGPDGAPVRRDIVKALPMGLDRMALEAAKAWRFNASSAKRRKATLEFLFELDSDSQAPPRFRFEGPFRLITWAPTPVVDRTVY
jgi:TonB family protein